MSVSCAAISENSAKVIDKHAVAESFSRAANSYDGVANIQRWVIKQLLGKIPNDGDFKRVLDIGCGTGHLSQQLAIEHAPNHIVGLDIAEGMVKVANQKWVGSTAASISSFEAICGDAEAMPFSSNEFSISVSSFALQWCPNLPVVFSEVYRTLEPGGQLYFALPTDGTLKELKQCWSQVDPINTHVNDFYRLDDLEIAAREAGFSKQKISGLQVEEHYQDLKALTFALKAMGAHNVTPGRAKQLTGKAKIKQLKERYESFRRPEGLPATWEVAFGVLQK